MMFHAGIGSIFFSIVSIAIPNVQLDILIGNYYKNVERLLIEISLAFLAMTANGLLILANKLSSPTINSVIRRSEILMVLAYDAVILDKFPDSTEICGYTVVSISVISISFSDYIQDLLSGKRNEEANP